MCTPLMVPRRVILWPRPRRLHHGTFPRDALGETDRGLLRPGRPSRRPEAEPVRVVQVLPAAQIDGPAVHDVWAIDNPRGLVIGHRGVDMGG
jgi:hypothetical protein